MCAGTGSFSQPFADRGHEVITLDYEARFNSTLTMDARAFAKNPWQYLPPAWKPDVVLLEPMCTRFSHGGSGTLATHWAEPPPGREWPFYGPRWPRTKEAREACGLVLACLEIVRKLDPTYWWMENPKGGLVTMGFMRQLKPALVSYCQYGDIRMKPTHLWGHHPKTWQPRYCGYGMPCHEAAPPEAVPTEHKASPQPKTGDACHTTSADQSAKLWRWYYEPSLPRHGMPRGSTSGHVIL